MWEHLLPNLTHAALESAPAAAHWIGWSLGALVSMQAAALLPDSVRSLTILSGTPRFVAGPDWPGVDATVLRRFADDLGRDYHRTIDRFLALQLHGMDDERALLKALRARVAEREQPAVAGLNAGLRILEETDLRVMFAALRLPILMILGARDRLVPAGLGAAISGVHPKAEVQVIQDAGHIPFWTHVEETERLVNTFLSGPHAA
jgi:pimeloyl-[acyl-carrier protein] methyl ester esterase